VLYKAENLTGCVVALKSKSAMRQFLRDRQRSVDKKMRSALAAGLRAGVPAVDALISEMGRILALQRSLK